MQGNKCAFDTSFWESFYCILISDGYLGESSGLLIRAASGGGKTRDSCSRSQPITAAPRSPARNPALPLVRRGLEPAAFAGFFIKTLEWAPPCWAFVGTLQPGTHNPLTPGHAWRISTRWITMCFDKKTRYIIIIMFSFLGCLLVFMCCLKCEPLHNQQIVN